MNIPAQLLPANRGESAPRTKNADGPLVVFLPLFDWLFVQAQWSGTTPESCPDKSAACWPFIWARFDQFMYGLYPQSERWRIDLGMILAVLCSLPLFIRALNATLPTDLSQPNRWAAPFRHSARCNRDTIVVLLPAAQTRDVMPDSVRSGGTTTGAIPP